MKVKGHKSQFKPALGRIVHYTDNKNKKPMAAIIIIVRDGAEEIPLGKVDLNVFDPNSSGGHLARGIPQWHKIKEGHWWAPEDQRQFEEELRSKVSEEIEKIEEELDSDDEEGDDD